MDGITDPRIREIMARLNQGSPGTSDQGSKADDIEKKKEPEETKPPRTFEEFLQAEKLDEWPQRITSENLLDLSDERDLLGSKDDIMNELRKSTLLDMTVLGDLENRLQDFEERISAVADQMIVDAQENSDGGALVPMSINRAFLTEANEGDIMKVHPSRKKKKADFKEETRKHSVEYCNFPGYHKGELTELPGQLEAPQILNRVTKAQDISPGLKKFWKKIFQSEASVAMMQDAFWWFFIKNFEKKKKKEGSKLFDRIADSFVALFNSVNPEIKDKIFSIYSDCLAQSVYIAFIEAFPESERHFGDEFKQQLINTLSEWITGIKPVQGGWQDWDMKQLQPKTRKQITDSNTQVTEMATLQKDVKQSLDMTDFHRTVNQLGKQDRLADVIALAADTPLTREATKMMMKTDSGQVIAVPVTTTRPITPSRHAECGTPHKQPVESSKIGPGPEMERVMFSLYGRSPLVTHYLRMRQLAPLTKTAGRRVRRTQIVKEPTETRTYKDLITETAAVQDNLSKEYRRICDFTQHEISRIERQQREASRRIEQLQKDISHCRTSMEVKLMGEKILDSRDWDLGSRQDMRALMDEAHED